MTGPVVTIGVFDGVHLGHRALISRARAEADRRGVGLTALTFDPHPLAVVRPGSEPTLLCSVSQRVRLLREAGADDVLVLEFDEALADESPEEFVDSWLVGSLAASAVLVGENFTFGRRAAGTVSTLVQIGQSRGFDVISCSLVDDPAGPVSSTRVRALIGEGDVATAAELLGRPHRVVGPVVHGDHRGRELGYPTANLGPTPTATVPADGVYAARLVMDPEGAESPSWPAAVSVGTNPTFGENSRRVEAFAIDAGADLDLYGQMAAVDFVERLRGMEAFGSVDELLDQMARDVMRARELLGG